jgi:exopolysaccharide production protein ExoZ
MAACMVLVFHAVSNSGGAAAPHLFAFPGGAEGVDVFFAISGFVMVISTRRLTRLPGAGRLFLKRRFVRILPLYWMMTSLALLLFAMHRHGGNWASLTGKYVLGSYLLFPTWHSNPPEWHPIVGPGWTLCFEMFFYFLFACTLRARRPFLLLASLIAAPAAVGLLRIHSGPAVLQLCDPRLLEFLAGVAIAKITLGGRTLPWVLSLASVPFFVWAVLSAPVRDPGLLAMLEAGTAATLLVFAAVSTERTIGERLPRWGIFLGEASYAIYISHILVYQLLFFPLRAVNAAAQHTLALAPVVPALKIAIAILLGSLLHLYIEKPLHRHLLTRTERSAATH